MLANWNGTTFDHTCPVDGHTDTGLTVAGNVLTNTLDGTNYDQSTFGVQCSQDHTIEWFDTGVPAPANGDTSFWASQATIIRAIMGVLGWTTNPNVKSG